MRPTQHKTNNAVLVGEGSVMPLPCTMVVYKHPVDPKQDQSGVVSYWTPTREEKLAILEGAPIVLSFIGQTHPPVRVGVEGVAQAGNGEG